MGQDISITVEKIERTTTKAIAIKREDSDELIWLPASQINVYEGGDGVTIELPEWLAKTKGLL